MFRGAGSCECILKLKLVMIVVAIVVITDAKALLLCVIGGGAVNLDRAYNQRCNCSWLCSQDEAQKYLNKRDYGRVPSYLMERKMELAEQAEEKERQKEMAMVPPGR